MSDKYKTMRHKNTVGIITMHRVQNYGSVLQSYALMRSIIKLGYDTKIINYYYPNDFHANESRNAVGFFTRLKFRILYRAVIQRRKFELFRKNNLNETSPYQNYKELLDNPPIFDIYVTGSDQVWNYQTMKGDPAFFCQFAKKPLLFSYASSFAQHCVSNEFIEKYKSYLLQYRSLGVREESAVNIIKELISKEAVVVCDPTLLLSSVDYSKLISKASIKIKRPYILAYILEYAYDPHPTIEQLIRRIHKDLNIDVIYLHSNTINNYHWGRSITSAGPNDFLSLISGASFVVTSSFHGVAFSLNFEIPFYAVTPKSVGDDRIVSLLKKVGGLSRAIKTGTQIETIDLCYEMNYNEISPKLNKYREASAQFLYSSLTECEQAIQH